MTQIGLALFWLSALLTLYTGWDYLRAGSGTSHRGLRCMKALYFAWVRERIGLAEEEIAPPPGVATIAELIAWLHGRGEGYEARLRQSKSDPRRARPHPCRAMTPRLETPAKSPFSRR